MNAHAKRVIKRWCIKNSMSIVIISAFILLCGEPGPEISSGEYFLRTAIDFGVIFLASRPLNRVLEVEARAERIRKTNERLQALTALLDAGEVVDTKAWVEKYGNEIRLSQLIYFLRRQGVQIGRSMYVDNGAGFSRYFRTDLVANNS